MVIHLLFLANYYIVFVIIDVFILFGLIGYLIEKKKGKKAASDVEVLETIKFNENKTDDLTINIGDNANKSLNSVVSNNVSVQKEEETETLM